MNQFHVLLAFFSFLSPVISHATTLMFTGPAAEALFICDSRVQEHPVIECWFARGASYCVIYNFDGFEIRENSALRVSGKVAITVFDLTKDCHDGGAVEYRHHYGQETRIKCRHELSSKELSMWCDLPIDSHEVFEGG